MEANRIPKLKDKAIGITNCACTLVSNSSGNKPTKVVRVVSNMARKRFLPAFKIASSADRFSAFPLLANSTNIKLSFTTTPAKAIIPNSDNMLTAISNIT